MQEINAKILKQRITKSSFFISQYIEDKLDIKINCKAKLKTSKDINDKSVLLNVELNIISNDELEIQLIADVVFELEQLLDDYNEVAEDKLIPMACKSILDALDDILVVMGYSKLRLAEGIGKRDC